jgi:hypothetical protein
VTELDDSTPLISKSLTGNDPEPVQFNSDTQVFLNKILARIPVCPILVKKVTPCIDVTINHTVGVLFIFRDNQYLEYKEAM